MEGAQVNRFDFLMSAQMVVMDEAQIGMLRADPAFVEVVFDGAPLPVINPKLAEARAMPMEWARFNMMDWGKSESFSTFWSDEWGLFPGPVSSKHKIASQETQMRRRAKRTAKILGRASRWVSVEMVFVNARRLGLRHRADPS